MKTLIVDNYDSFTYNLYHLFYRVTGEEPLVIKNDDPDWCDDWLENFEQIVISPGPGHPEVAKDLGISNFILSDSSITKPILGICLGHQGICFAGGAQIKKALQPMHGRVNKARHNNHALFKNIPEQFDVVRYHSLAAYNLSHPLNPLAWTNDGTIMAVEHTELPRWGLQFHPESICAENGDQLVRNFCELTNEYYRGTPTPIHDASPVEPSSKKLPVSTVRQYELSWKLINCTADSDAMFSLLFGTSERAVWLDSNDLASPLSQFSMMGDSSGPHARWVVADAGTGQVEFSDNQTSHCIEKEPFFEWLDNDLSSIKLNEAFADELPFDARPGWYGHLGYELKGDAGGTLSHQADLPDAAMIFIDRLIVVDHRNDICYALALHETNDDQDKQQAEEWIDSIEPRLSGNYDKVAPPSLFELPQGTDLSLRHSPRSYVDRIEECLREINNGETYEVCLTNTLSFTLTQPTDHLSVYRKLRIENPTSFSTYVKWPKWSVIGFSPERFMRVDRNRVAESRPIKGTRKRSQNVIEDAALREDLRSSEKDKAENLMIVDLVRNDLGRSATSDGVKADPLFEVESYATVHQLVSTIKAELRPEVTSVQCIRDAFPGGSMTGAPKIRTMEIIDRLEEGARGIYSGSIGYLGVNGSADFNIVIRSLVLSDQSVSIGTGGAIIALSNPEEELKEIALKCSALLTPFGLQFPAIDQVVYGDKDSFVPSKTVTSEDPVELIEDDLVDAIIEVSTTNEGAASHQFLVESRPGEMPWTQITRIEILGISDGLLLHGMRSDQAIKESDSVSILLTNESAALELIVAGRLVIVEQLEADAAFSTLSRVQQLSTVMLSEEQGQSSSVTAEEKLEKLAIRYEGQAIARPSGHSVFRLVPSAWQKTDTQLSDGRLRQRKSVQENNGKWSTEESNPFVRP